MAGLSIRNGMTRSVPLGPIGLPVSLPGVTHCRRRFPPCSGCMYGGSPQICLSEPPSFWIHCWAPKHPLFSLFVVLSPSSALISRGSFDPFHWIPKISFVGRSAEQWQLCLLIFNSKSVFIFLHSATVAVAMHASDVPLCLFRTNIRRKVRGDVGCLEKKTINSLE